MHLTAKQHQTLEEMADNTEETGTRIVVTGSDPATGSLELRVEQRVRLLPNGLTTDG